jgi:zinc/manganese transport system permease protein
MLEAVLEPWRYSFMQRALAEALLIAVACGPIGALVMLRRLAFAGESLGHALVPGAALFAGLGLAAGWGALAGVLVAALAVAWIVRRGGEREDAVIATVFGVVLAGGALLLALTLPSQRAIAVLFGDLLAVSRGDIALAVAAAAGLSVVVVGGLRMAVLTAFDRPWAAIAGVRVGLVDAALLVGAAVALTVALRGLGALLGLALLLAPAAVLRPWCERVPRLVLLTIPVGASAGVAGLLVSYHLGAAAGPAIASILCGLFLLSRLAAPVLGGRPRRA